MQIGLLGVFPLFGLAVFIFTFQPILKFLTVPGLVAEKIVGDGAAVEDDLLGLRAEFGAVQISGGRLQSVEEEAGSLVFDFAGEKLMHDLHQRKLDGVGILENRQLDWSGQSAARGVGVALGVHLLPAVVKIAETASFERGRAALGSVDLDVLTASDVGGIKFVGITHI